MAHGAMSKVPDGRLPTGGYRLKFATCRLMAEDCDLPTDGCGLRTENCGLRSADFFIFKSGSIFATQLKLFLYLLAVRNA